MGTRSNASGVVPGGWQRSEKKNKAHHKWTHLTLPSRLLTANGMDIESAEGIIGK